MVVKFVHVVFLWLGGVMKKWLLVILKFSDLRGGHSGFQFENSLFNESIVDIQY